MLTLPIPKIGGLLGFSWAGQETQNNRAARNNVACFMLTSWCWRGTRFYLANFVKASAKALFEALVGGLVVRAAGKIVGKAGHVCHFFFEIVGVFVAFAVANVFHKAGDGVAEVQGNGVGFGFVHVIEDIAIGSVNGIGLWRER